MHEGLIALAEGICEKHKVATDIREMRREARRLIQEAYNLGAREKEAEILKPAPPVSRIAPATQASTPSTSEKPAEVKPADTSKSPAERRKPGPKPKAEKAAEPASVEAPKEETPADAPQPDAAAATEPQAPESF